MCRKYPLGRLRRKWVNNINTYLKEIGFEVDGNSSGSCPVAGFSVTGSASTVLG
jgi:hypothetical protein